MRPNFFPSDPRVVQGCAFGLVLLVGFFVYFNTTRTDFVLDDYHFIVENPIFNESNPLPILARAMVTDGGAFYRPVAVFSFIFEHGLFGMSAVAFHLGSVAFHLLATLLLMLLIRSFAPLSVTLVAGLLFVVHPVHTEAVTALSNRPEVIATVFYLAVLLLYQQNSPSLRRILFANLLFLLGLLSKESAFTLPLAVFALIWWQKKRESPWRAAFALVPAMSLYLLLRQHALRAITYDAAFGYFQTETGWEKFLTLLKVVPIYTRLAIYPSVLSADYSRHAITNAQAWDAKVLLGLAIVLGLLAIVGSAAWVRLGVPPASRDSLASSNENCFGPQLQIALGLVLLGIGCLPYMHLTPIGFLVAERYLYLPSCGLALAVAAFLMLAARWIRSPPLVYTIVFGLVVWLSFRTALRNLDWTDPFLLWQATVKAVPQSGFAHANLGLSAYWAGQPALAAQELEQAIGLTPERLPFYLALAKIYHRGGHHPKELALLRLAAVRFGPLMSIVGPLELAAQEQTTEDRP